VTIEAKSAAITDVHAIVPPPLEASAGELLLSQPVDEGEASVTE
jgi:hypothetical protein